MFHVTFLERIFQMKKFLFIVLACAALSACHDTRYVFTNQFPTQPSYSRTQHYIWWGRKSTIEPLQVCGSMNNVAMIEEKENGGQSWLRYLTVGIYSPVTVNVYCKTPMTTSYRARQPQAN